MTIQHLEQFDQGQRRLGLAILVARKGVHSAPKNFGGFALIQVELLAHLGDKGRVDVGRIQAPEPSPP